MKEKIKEVALGLFMRYGIKSVSMDDIAQSAGISKKTIYLHVGDKKTLVHQSLVDFIKCDKELVLNEVNRKDTNALEKMIFITKKTVETFKKIKPSVLYDLQKYYHESWSIVQSYHSEFMLKIICENIIQGKQENVYREDVDPSIISKLFVGKMIMLAEEEEFPHDQYPKPYLFAQQLLYHLYGLVNHENFSKLQTISKNIL